MKKRPKRQPIYPSRTPTVTGALSAGRAHFPQARSWGERTHFQQETSDGWGGRCGPRREEVTIGKRSPNVPHCPSAVYICPSETRTHTQKTFQLLALLLDRAVWHFSLALSILEVTQGH